MGDRDVLRQLPDIYPQRARGVIVEPPKVKVEVTSTEKDLENGLLKAEVQVTLIEAPHFDLNELIGMDLVDAHEYLRELRAKTTRAFMQEFQQVPYIPESDE